MDIIGHYIMIILHKIMLCIIIYLISSYSLPESKPVTINEVNCVSWLPTCPVEPQQIAPANSKQQQTNKQQMQVHMLKHNYWKVDK